MNEVVTFPEKDVLTRVRQELVEHAKRDGGGPIELHPRDVAALVEKPPRKVRVRNISALPPGGHTKVEVRSIKHPSVRDAINRIGDWLMHLDTERDTLTEAQAQRLTHHLEAVEGTMAGIAFLLGPTKPMGGKRA